MVSLEIIEKCLHGKVENYKFLFKYTIVKMYISFFSVSLVTVPEVLVKVYSEVTNSLYYAFIVMC